MNRNRIHYLWRGAVPVRQFQTGVSLHGHTMYSQECLSFLPRYLARVPGAAGLLRRHERARREPVRFERAYWTPPLGPAAALSLERKQIASIGLRPLVSLTDHDDIQAGTALQVTSPNLETPISVEWTVPFEKTVLHLGVHNLPPASAQTWISTLNAFTAAPCALLLPELLSALHRIPEVLLVLNHPFWLEEGVADSEHRRALARFLREDLAWIHAFELNATRPRGENAETIELARAFGRPVVSGGDRHACEPSGCINLTNESTFAGFAAEVREGRGEVLFMPQYREPLALRILEMCWDILRPYPEYAGRERWTDRVFYRGDDEIARPLSALWDSGPVRAVNLVTGVLQALAAAKPGLALLLREGGEVLS